MTAAGRSARFVIARVAMVYLLSADLQLAPGYAMQFAPEFNVSVAAVACGSTLLALLVFGVIPALHGARANVRLRPGVEPASGAGTTPWRGRRNLIACQVAVSAGLVSVAVLCAQQVIATAKHESGFDLDRIAAASVDFRMQKKDRRTDAESWTRCSIWRACNRASTPSPLHPGFRLGSEHLAPLLRRQTNGVRREC